jgi:cytidine deaminase
VLSNSYSPYSNFKVAAAILTENGIVYTGVNVENASYGATICAERTAAVKAVSEGERKFIKIAIISSSGEFTYPCGICRQFLADFMDDASEVILSNDKGEEKVFKFGELIPGVFRGEDIK